tara:strand:+ start:393 stop:794 length:402 start_codon:yes stop_codon:yes gene_type:complete
MRYNRPRRNKFGSNDRGFRRNDSQDTRTGAFSSASKSFQRRSFSGNGFRPEKLLEKYNNLAKEASSNGDKILSESYYQHADHFLRVIESRNLIQNNSKPHLDNSSIGENSDDKIILEDKKNSSSQQPQNSEEV